MKTKLAVLLVCATLSAPSGAQDSTRASFEFRGERFGDTLSVEARRKLGVCRDVKETPGLVACFGNSRGRFQMGDETFSIGETTVTPTRFFLDGRLIAIDLSFRSVRYGDLSDALTARYGEPDSTLQSTIQNRMGASFNQEEKVWLFGGERPGALSIERYGSDLNDGRVFATENAGTKEWTRRSREAKAAAALRDLAPPRNE